MTKRECIRNHSPYKNSRSWQDKVDKMSDAQVTAIYLRFMREGLLECYATR